VEDVIPLYSVALAFRTAQAPQRVYLAPSRTPLDFSYDRGYTRVIVPNVQGHQMVVAE